MPGGATRNEGVPGSSPGVGFRQRLGPSSPLHTSGSTASTSREGRDAEFNEYVLKLGEGVKNHFTAVARGKAADAAAAPLGFGCWACKAGVWAIAGAVMALGVAGVAAISPEADVVVLPGRFAGLGARAVAGFISGLGPSSRTASARSQRLWVGSC
jgi:hypothetical protein